MAFPRRLLSEGEELILDVRPHWMALVIPAIEVVAILVGMIVAINLEPGSWPGSVTLLIVLVALFLLLVTAVRRFLAWASSHFVVTSDRLIHRSGWLSKHSMEIPLENVTDVKFHQGAVERMIGAGDLLIESPGEFGQETFSYVRNPESVQKLIYEMTEDNRRRMSQPSPRPPLASVADELEKLHRLAQQGVITQEEFQAQKARLLGG